MEILGIDPSLNSSGLCIINENNTIRYMESINPLPLKDFDRLQYNYMQFKSILDCFSEVSIVGMEQPLHHMAANAGTIMLLAESLGVLKLAIREVHRPLIVYGFPPCMVKQEATGSGNATKEEMLQVMTKTNIKKISRCISEEAQDDVVDAYYIARLASKSYKEELNEDKIIFNTLA